MRKPETIAFWVGRLPHWEVEDGRYFVTIHLAGAIPASGRNRLRALATELQQCEPRSDSQLALRRKIFAEMERWLDRAEYKPLLKDQLVAEMIIEAIENREERGIWKVFDYVVMPNHLHLFFELCRPGLKKVLEDFKRWTGTQACRLLNLVDGQFWQREWFDHWSRSDSEDDRIERYVQRNPEAAGLVEHAADWPWCKSGRPNRK